LSDSTNTAKAIRLRTIDHGFFFVVVVCSVLCDMTNRHGNITRPPFDQDEVDNPVQLLCVH